jgi:hypothetical protein
MRVTVATTLPAEHAAVFYPLYLDAFAPLRATAAARHVLSDEEFGQEMADTRVLKYIAWNEAGIPIGLSTFTQDLDSVPWVSAEFYQARYPEHAARGAIFYLGFTLVDPAHQRSGALVAMLAEMGKTAIAEHAVVGYDICNYNLDTMDFANAVARVMRTMSPVTVDVLDTQTYYAMTFPKAAA